MEENEQALNYVESFIKGLNINFSVSSSYQSFTYYVTVSFEDNEHVIEFSRSLVDDFQVALEKCKGTPYFITLESANHN